jgi:hypothetical protein
MLFFDGVVATRFCGSVCDERRARFAFGDLVIDAGLNAHFK